MAAPLLSMRHRGMKDTTSVPTDFVGIFTKPCKGETRAHNEVDFSRIGTFYGKSAVGCAPEGSAHLQSSDIRAACPCMAHRRALVISPRSACDAGSAFRQPRCRTETRRHWVRCVVHTRHTVFPVTMRRLV